jgi:hypothetical protein
MSEEGIKSLHCKCRGYNFLCHMRFFYSEEIILIFSGLDILLAFSGELLDSGLINLFGPTQDTAVL